MQLSRVEGEEEEELELELACVEGEVRNHVMKKRRGEEELLIRRQINI